MRKGCFFVFGAILGVVGCSSPASKSNDTGGAGGVGGGTGGSTSTGGTAGTDAGTGGAAGSAGSGGLGGSAGAAGSGGAPGLPWHALAAPSGQEDASVLGVYCAASDKCVIATKSNTGDPGAVFAMSDTAVGTKLLDGTYQAPLSNVSAVLGDLDFWGFSPTQAGLVARVSDASVYAVAASGSDITQASSWSFVSMGHDASDGSRVGGDFANIQVNASNKWILVASGNVYSGTATPSGSATWTGIWDPTRTPPYPDNFNDLYSADNTLCDADVTAGGIPFPSDPIYVSPDLSLMVSVAGGLNQNENGNAQVGVCVSTDQGQHFYYVPFAGTPSGASSPGPVGVTCTDNDHCYAYNGEEFDTGTAYIYYSENASQGKSSTWTPATVPSSWASSEEITLSALFFAPDKMHGWAVGNNNHVPLLMRTTDAGHTWTDVSTEVSGLQGAADLYNGFALDADHIWVVGRFGFIAATGNAQQ